jgi:membrane protease subunit HflK
VVNEAVGTAAALRQQAEGYREQVVAQASGEAARFNQLQAQYQLNPGVTRERLYLETMERVLRDSNKVVVDTGQGGASAPIILPPEVFRGNNARVVPAAPQAQSPSAPAGAAAGAAR